MEAVGAVVGMHPRIVEFAPAYLRLLGIWVEHNTPNFPMPVFWQDYLAADRTCELDTLPRLFGLMPERLEKNLDYLASFNKKSVRANSVKLG
jgi:hypothetical protein